MSFKSSIHWIDNVLLINTRSLSIVIDKPIPLSIAFPTIPHGGIFLELSLFGGGKKKTRDEGKKCHTKTMMKRKSDKDLE